MRSNKKILQAIEDLYGLKLTKDSEIDQDVYISIIDSQLTAGFNKLGLRGHDHYSIEDGYIEIELDNPIVLKLYICADSIDETCFVSDLLSDMKNVDNLLKAIKKLMKI